MHIEKWWEIMFSAYLMISLNTPAFLSLNSSQLEDNEIPGTNVDFSTHPQWSHQGGWKSALNNFRLIIQPIILFGLVNPWLDVIPSSSILRGFHHLIDVMNQFQPVYFSG